MLNESDIITNVSKK